MPASCTRSAISSRKSGEASRSAGRVTASAWSHPLESPINLFANPARHAGSVSGLIEVKLDAEQSSPVRQGPVLANGRQTGLEHPFKGADIALPTGVDPLRKPHSIAPPSNL